ncbi:MAG: FAD-dependent oxidoreductase, partial [Thermoleophilaceae bacterium]
DEYRACTAGRLCDQTGIDHERLRRDGSVQWPCPARDPALGEHTGSERLYADHRYPTPSGRARVVPTPHAEPAESPDARFPLVLTTGRVASQWHTMTRTGKSPDLVAAEPEPFLELHPADARRAGVRHGRHARVVSRRGTATLRLRVVDSIREGTAFAPFHWGALHAAPGAGALNAATSRASDPTSRQPELKACAVRVEPVAARMAWRRGAPRRRDADRRLLIVGTGMAALATVEAALEHRPAGWRIAMLGREPDPPYNRILLSRLLARGCAEEGLAMHPASWYAQRGVELRAGTEARALDLDRRAVLTAAGERLGYDALVIATGSRPLVPPIEGIEREGVHLFRTLADARAIAAHAERARRAVVIGGGLLGLEAARGLVELGLHVSVVHLVDRLMETQLDPPAARLLERGMRALGVEVLPERSTTAVLGNGRAEGVRLTSGEELAADMVVVSVGIRPEVQLARDAGLEVGRGIHVDDELRTSAAAVWAVGECAEHREQIYGVWGPLLEQARAAGASLAGRPAAFHGGVPATTLKVMGVDLFTAGRHSAADDSEDEVVALDSRAGLYRKLVLREGRLVGAILLGDLAASAGLAELSRSGEPVPEELLALGGPPLAAAPQDDSALVCTCNEVSRAAILAVARDRGLKRVEEVTEA